jgi:hypothetical protein
VAGVAVGALAVLAVTLPLDRDESAADWPTFLALLGLTVALTVITVEMQAGTRVSVAGIGLLALGFQFGAGAAMLGANVLALAHGIRTRASPHAPSSTPARSHLRRPPAPARSSASRPRA